jgi:hypothetical protein
MDELKQRQRNMRFRLLQALRLELLGPHGGEAEELRERPTLRYLTGRLAPSGTQLDPEEDEVTIATATDEEQDVGPADGINPITMSMNPSSIGISFIVAADVAEITVVAGWGEYSEERRPQTKRDGTERERSFWLRTSITRSHTLRLLDRRSRARHDLGEGIWLDSVCHRLSDGRTSVSAFLVNRREADDPIHPSDRLWIFQPELKVTGEGKPFVARRLEDVGGIDPDPELRSAELLYWNTPEYAAGHGCAAEWEVGAGSERADSVRTAIIPDRELPLVAPVQTSVAELDMEELGGDGPEGVSGDLLRERLQPLVDEYREWIDRLEDRRDHVVSDLRETAQTHTDACRIAADRIQEGIDLVASDSVVRRAFCFANRAMALQLQHSRRSLARRRGEPLPHGVVTRWYPFQLAFMLLNLPALSMREHEDRRIADLLWFPTGGGKTEAYLGLTAFALAHRRLRESLPGYSSGGAGVSVLMRYTLRLLTIQQFQRAAALICACEVLRREEAVWGATPFSIGLWVGQSATNNVYSSDSSWEEGAKEALARIQNGHRPKSGSPVQLLHCPWCGSALDPKKGDYDPDDDLQRVLVHCSDDECDFNPTRVRSLPVHMVDDDIYRSVPSLVIATVDKFARMPWKGQTQALFGRVARWCAKHGYLTSADAHSGSHRKTRVAPKIDVVSCDPLEPPDLIIQDELHLISGPLGTLVGMYETAVDGLASASVGDMRVPPKIIASTATIRRAEDQVQRLFDRSFQVFPPPGLEATDSHFGALIDASEVPGRVYVGISAPGKSVKTALVRVYAALLSSTRLEHRADWEAADAYMTLVAYFNSLRELGGALRLVEDDVPARIKVLARRDRSEWSHRDLYVREQLTSNRKADEIPAILAQLERRFPEGKPESGRYPVDVLLASNMLSVGVDIPRLGLMVVNGQPKATAEYIQATSRVGRQHPGLILTVYNWTRPRDLSHFERFRSYHTMLYRFVEATGVTPFSSRARDRGLEGVLTSLIRLGSPVMTPEQAAGQVETVPDVVDWARSVLESRARNVKDDRAADATAHEIDADVDRWRQLASAVDVCYTRFGLDKERTRRYLLGPMEEDHDGLFEAPGSLREVEAEVHVYLEGEP